MSKVCGVTNTCLTQIQSIFLPLPSWQGLDSKPDIQADLKKFDKATKLNGFIVKGTLEGGIGVVSAARASTLRSYWKFLSKEV